MRVHIRRTRIAVVVALTLLLSGVSVFPAARKALANGVQLHLGDLLLGDTNSNPGAPAPNVYHYSATGTLLDTLNTTSLSHWENGMCFDAAGDFFVANVDSRSTSIPFASQIHGTISEFDRFGNLLNREWGGVFDG